MTATSNDRNPANVVFAQGLPRRLQRLALSRGDIVCRACGAAPGDLDDISGQPVELHVGPVVDDRFDDPCQPDATQTFCATCRDGMAQIKTERPTAIWLLSQVRRAGHTDQRTVYERLHKKFGEQR